MATTYVFCPRKSDSALELTRALNGVRLRRFDGQDFWNKRQRVRLDPGATLICWGTSVPELDGVNVVNSLDAPLNKYQEWAKLSQHVATLSVYKPAYGELNVETSLAYKNAGYIGRSVHHQGGLDLLNGIKVPDYMVMKENFTAEYRIHSFDGRSIRAGIKQVRDEFTPVADEKDWRPNSNLAHPWIRSFDGGWRINYDGFKSKSAQRNLAHAAVKALGLTFGAVDIGLVADGGGLKVLEVNSAPGSDPNTTAAYVRSIQRLINKEPAEEGKEA